MSWIKDLISPKTREWEEFYRNRFQHDKVVRSTHGVNCTGGCSWQIHVKDGIVVLRIKYPLVRGALLDVYREEKKENRRCPFSVGKSTKQ
jgi:nitrate reductase alpha subunit